jgi:hypothetical protein
MSGQLSSTASNMDAEKQPEPELQVHSDHDSVEVKDEGLYVTGWRLHVITLV